MTVPAVPDLKRALEQTIPEWVALDPARRQQVQYALRQVAFLAAARIAAAVAAAQRRRCLA